MSAAVIDTFTGQPDPGLTDDAALEARIDSAERRMRRKDASDEKSLEAFSEFYRLVLQRSPTQQVKLELERRLLAKVDRRA